MFLRQPVSSGAKVSMILQASEGAARLMLQISNFTRTRHRNIWYLHSTANIYINKQTSGAAVVMCIVQDLCLLLWVMVGVCYSCIRRHRESGSSLVHYNWKYGSKTYHPGAEGANGSKAYSRIHSDTAL